MTLKTLLWAACFALPFTYGVICGSKESSAKHLLFDMAVHRAAISQLEGIDQEYLERNGFDYDLQMKALGDTIGMIEGKGFYALLEGSGNHSNRRLLEMIYTNSKRCLCQWDKHEGTRE